MKKHIILFSLLVTLFTTMLPTTALAQQPDNQYAMLYWQNNGEFNAFLNDDVDSITYSKIDLNGRRHPNVVVQEIWTSDSVYRIPLTTIDSVTFNVPEPVFKEDIFHITEFHFPYVTDVTETAVTFDASIPSDSLPSVGQVVISDIAYEEPFVNGFAGRVTRIVATGGTVRIECEEVTIEDIYNELVCVGKVVTYNDNSPTPRAPRRLINEQGEIPISFGSFSLDLYNKGSEQVTLNVSPKITLDYVIRYKLFDNANNRFKFIVKKELDCDFNYNWEKSIDVDTVIFPSDALIIHTPVTGLNAYVNIGGYLDFSGSATLDLTQHFKLVSHFGYDSKESNNGRNGLVFGFDGTGFDSPTGSAKLSTSLSAGLAFQVGVCLISDKIAGANLTLKAGPRVSGDIEFNTDLTQDPSWYDFNESHLTFEPLTARLSGGVNIFTFSKDWNLWELPISSWFPVFGARELYMFPQFTAPSLPSLNESGFSLTALTTDISRNLLFSVTPGIGLYKNGQLKYTRFSNKTYKREVDWKDTDLQMELQQYASDTYIAKPIFKIFNKTVEAYPTSTVTIPASLSAPDAITVKNGESQMIDINGGWGNYTLTNSAASVCSATFVSNGTDVGTTWPPTTGSGYSNQTPKVKLTGLKNGSATITVTDKRSNQKATTSVTVNNTNQPPVITVNPETLDFSTVVKGYTAMKTFTVTGSNLTGDITLSSSNHVFKINKTTLTPSNGTVSATVTVTYEPDEAVNNGGYINIYSDGVERVRVALSGTCEEGYINVNPTTLSFGNSLIPSKTYSKSFTLTTNVPGILNSSYSETVSGVFTVPSPIKAGSNTVKFMSSDAGSYSGVININDPKSGATARVTMDAQVAATITADPTSWDFGTVVKGYTSVKAFTITGKGLTSNMTVSSNSSNFKVSKTSLSASGGSFNVTYQPSAAGSHSATITISGGGTTKTISVSGKCENGYITVTPTALSFGNGLIPSKTYSKSFTVTTNVPGTLSSSYSETVSGVFTVPSVTGAGSHTVKFMSSDAGNYSGVININDAKSGATARVTMDAQVAATITADPTSWDFGTVVKGYTSVKAFTITGKGLTSNMTVSSNSSNFKVSKTSLNASGGSFNVTYQPSAAGSHSTTITISGCGTTITVPVNGKCENGYITVTPTALSFGNGLIPSKTYSKSFTVTTNVPGALSSSYSETVSGVFTVPSVTGAGSYTVKFMSSDAGSYSGVININDPKSGATARVTMDAQVAATISADPTSWDFGTVVKGYTSVKAFTITGKGLTSNMTVSSNSSNFKVSKTSLSASGGSFNVTYQPSAAGSHSATITISGGGTTKTISVSGKCENGYITVTPTALSFGNSLIPSKTYSKSFTVTTNVPGALSSSYSETVSGVFTVPSVTGAGSYTVKFMSSNVGSYSGVININDPKSGATARVTMDATVAASLTVSPQIKDFGTVTKGGIATATFTITGTNLNTPITLVEPFSETTGGEFSIYPKSLPATGGTVTVTYNALYTGAAGAAFKYKSGNLVVNFSVSANCVAPAPSVTVNPGSVEFNASGSKLFNVKGSNLTNDLSLVLKNNSNGYFSINKTTISKSEASSSTGSSVKVTFTRPSTGNLTHASAQVEIWHNGTLLKTVYLSYLNDDIIQPELNLSGPTDEETGSIMKEAD